MVTCKYIHPVCSPWADCVEIKEGSAAVYIEIHEPEPISFRLRVGGPWMGGHSRTFCELSTLALK